MASKSMEHIGRKIMHYRLKQGLTPAEFARKANISPQQYKKIERGESSIQMSTFEKIVKTLGVSSSLILSGLPK